MSKVIKELNQIQADSYSLFLKFHNYHWNVKGLQFFSIHGYTEEAYDEMATIFDDTAERAIQLGGQALLLNSELVKKSKIKEESKTSFTPKVVLENMQKDYKYLLKAFKALSDVANKEGDAGTIAIADEKVAQIEKRLWMLEATLS